MHEHHRDPAPAPAVAGIAIVLCERAPGDAAAEQSLTLTFEQRQRSRQRLRLDSGLEAALMLPRGSRLRAGDRLRSECGRVVLVHAAPEAVSTGRAADGHTLARACYHLGNRHLPVEIGPGWLRFAQDHVIDELARRLGLEVEHGEHPFQPEDGAYAGGHAHDHGSAHGHDHDHGEGHDHGQHPHDHAH